MTAPGGAYAAFRPELHPRDSHGRFRDKWGLPAAAKKLVDGIVNAFKPMMGSSDEDLQAKVDAHAAKRKRSPKQKAALDRFTSNGFAPVQADLRAKKSNADAAEMQSMLEPLPEDMLLTRVVGPEAFGLNAQRIGEVEEWTGKLVADKGFAPTNVGTPFQVGAPHVTMSIMTPKGTPAIIPGGSREVILGPDQPLRIVKVDSDGRGGVYVYAVAQPGGRTRALGRGMRANEKAPAIDATPEELKKRGLQEPSPDVSGVQPAPGATPDIGAVDRAPEGTPQAPAEANAPDAKVADREAKVADREAKVAEREAQVAELRTAKKAGKKAAKSAKPEPNALEQVPADQADDKLNTDQIQRWRDAIGDDVELPQLHETMLAMTAEQLRKKEISRADAVKQLEDLARDRHTPADDFLRKVATVIGVGPEGKKVRAPRKKAEPGKTPAKRVPGRKAGNLAEEAAVRFPEKKAAPKKVAPKAATPKAATPPVKKTEAPAVKGEDVLARRAAERAKKAPPEVSTAGGRPIQVGDHVKIGGAANRGQHGRTTWKVTRVNDDGTVSLVSTFQVAGRPTRTRNSVDPKKLSHMEATKKTEAPEVKKVATPVPEAPKRGRHAAATTPPPASVPKLSTKDAVLEERRKQRAAARERQQQIAHAQGLAAAFAELSELERKQASGKVMAQHLRAIANGPDVEEIRDVEERDKLRKEIEHAADELEAGGFTRGHDILDNLTRKHGIELENNETGLVAFDPDKHEAVGGGRIARGVQVKVVRPGAVLLKGEPVDLFRAKVALPGAKAVPAPALPKRVKPRPEDIPELSELNKLQIDDVRKIAREQGLQTEDAFGRIPKHDLVAMLDGRRLAKQRMRDLDPDRKWKRVELEAMKVDELRNLIKAHGLVPPPHMRKLDLVEVLVGQKVNEPHDRNDVPDAAGGFADLDVKELKALAERNGLDVGWNPARAKMIRQMLAAGVDDPGLPAEEKSMKGLKIALGDLGIRIPPGATHEQLVSMLRDPPKIEYHQTVPARLKKLIASVASGVKRFNPIGDGQMGDTSKAEMEDGGEAIRKSHKFVFGQNPRRQADAEQLASVLAEAIGAPTPAVYRQDGRTIFMGFVAGKVAKRVSFERQIKAIESPEGKLLGLLDALTGNPDRHGGNWMITPDGKPVGIDHGLAWSIGFNVHSNPKPFRDSEDKEILPNRAANTGPFVDHWVNGVRFKALTQFSRKHLEEIREKLLARRPQFELLGRGAWFEVSLERLDAIIKRAKLP